MAASHRYLIPAGEHLNETVILKSRFLTYLAPADSPQAAMAFLARIREQHPDATHHCWAFLVGTPGSSGKVGMSDDGEPHGTAGRPMLNVLSHAEVGDIVAVVVRYYGGTKLGKGGLVRAYAGGVQEALTHLPTEEKIAYVPLRLLITYGQVDALKRLMATHEAKLLNQEYGVDPVFDIAVPEDVFQIFVDQWVDMTGGDTFWEKLEPSEET